MNVRKIIESYEREKSSNVAALSPRTGALRPRTRQRPRTHGTDTSFVATNQRSIRTMQPSSLKIVKEERPVTVVLKECMNELQIDQGPNVSRFSVPLPSDPSHNSWHPSITSAELLCAIAPPPVESSAMVPILSSSHSAYPSGISTGSTLQKRGNLRARRQQRYTREESALAAALQLPAKYGRMFPSRPWTQYALRQLESRVSDAKARLGEIRERLLDDTTDQVTHQAMLRTRWMLEHWIASAEKEHSCASTSARHPALPDAIVPSARKARQDANLAFFFAHSPTRTATLSPRIRISSHIEQPRRMSKHNVEPPLLRKWPLTTILRAPMKMKPKTFPSTSDDPYPHTSVASLPSQTPPSSPKRPRSSEVDLTPLSQPLSPLQDISTTSASSAVLDIPLDDSWSCTWTGFAVIYVAPQPSDEELLAVLSVDMEAEPMPEYVSYLLDQLEPIGEGVSLPGLSRRGTTTTSGFELISRPSVEVYEYPPLTHSRLLVRRNMRIPHRTRLGIFSGLRPVCEDPSIPELPRSSAQEQTSPRSGVFSKVRRSMTARGHQ